MMKFYLAARYGRREEIAAVAKRLTDIGHTVTSSWLQERHDAVLSDQEKVERAYQNLTDIRNAQVFVLFTDVEQAPSAGKDTEFGYALSLGKKLAVCGMRRNVFHSLPAVRHFQTIEEFIQWAKR